jgi:DNA repair protein RadD
MKILRPYQEDAFQDIRASVGQGVRRLVVQAPTGSGKTRLAAEIVVGAQLKGNPLCFVVPAISLIDQTVEMFADEGIRDIGVIQADHPLTDWSKPVQIASIQTVRRRGVYPNAKVVVFDECHQLHKEHIKWMGHLDRDTNQPTDCTGWETVPFIGLSATPWTRGLGRFFQSLLVMSTTKELISQGYLSPFQVFAADHPDLSGVKIVAGDYHEGQLSNVMQDNILVANIIKTYSEKWGKGKTFCFGVDCAHAAMLQARFLEAGISCAYQDARTPMSERKEIKEKFHNGEYQVVCNVGTLTTGVDWDVRCLILARPTKSEMLFVQIIGRALRTADGKDKAVILDHTDTTMRLGFASDIHHEHLNGGKFKQADKVVRVPRLPKPCPQCACLIPVGVKVCPACGFERVAPVSPIIERDGVLVEFDGIFRKRGDTVARTYSMQEKERFYAQLKGYALQQGYREGWAYHKYKDKFGSKPPWSIDGVSPMACGPEVRGWIRHTQIAWAKSKKNPNNANKRDV